MGGMVASRADGRIDADQLPARRLGWIASGYRTANGDRYGRRKHPFHDGDVAGRAALHGRTGMLSLRSGAM
jgi:hypothetical protein